MQTFVKDFGIVQDECPKTLWNIKESFQMKMSEKEPLKALKYDTNYR